MNIVHRELNVLDLRNRTKRHQFHDHLPTKADETADGMDAPGTCKPDLYAEHKKCLWLVDDLNDVLIEPRSKIVVQDHVTHLLAVVAMHFRHEEQLFALYGYLDGSRHRELHAGILARSRQLSNELNKAVSRAGWVKCGSRIARMLEEHLAEEQVIYGT